MTTPEHEPDWPDAELVSMALLDDLGWTCTALPDSEEWAELFPIIAINRIGGGVTRDGVTDRALVAVVVVDETRPKAQQAASKVRKRIGAAGCTQVDGILVDTTEEETGTVADPNLASDNRFIEMSFWLSFRMQ
ncbi:hypothetical protein OG563_26440 [Nocardia vinacea]|uniref:DUF3168 domain-containing protein n=1 Tax=Nocardia vinacea TaxID=96468 RepID=A0ABZ1YLC3_9NOCA|nr:hypothetical protein [Nocardia vinacea]